LSMKNYRGSGEGGIAEAVPAVRSRRV